MAAKREPEGCAACTVRGEMIEHLRQQNRELMDQIAKMQEKILCLAGDAATNYQRLKMTEAAQQHLPSMEGVVPLSAIDYADEESKAMDSFVNSFMGKGEKPS